MKWYEWIWWRLYRKVPSRFGVQITKGTWYDRYYNKHTKKKYFLEHRTGDIREY